LGTTADEIRRAVARARPLLFAAREKRVHPMRDDKALASWNALMISAFADAGATLGESKWIDAAVRALDYWREHAFHDGRLRHAIKTGEAYGDGFLDDYAGLACAAIDVYEARFNVEHLAFARALVDAMLTHFWDDAAGDFYYAPFDGEVVLSRVKEAQDHAYPGGVGLAADALLRLATLTGVLRYRSAAERLLGTLANTARENPLGMATLVRAIDRTARGAVEIVIVGDPNTDSTRALLDIARNALVPHRALLCFADEAHAIAAGIDPALARGRTPSASGAPRAFVCRGTVCDAPVESAGDLAKSLATR
jgi:uncharacterized protein YyaL (SSP411 family)